MTDLYYQVGDQIFLNKFQAADYAYRNNQQVKFNLYESAFDCADWTTEPSLTWNQLLDIRAKQIEAKGRPIILHFSGGTDSLTIYEIFKRNNIHIDVLYFRTREVQKNMDPMYQDVIAFLNKGIYDPLCKIVIKSELDGLELLEKAYHSEDWIWNSTQRYTFAYMSGNLIEHQRLLELTGPDAISVIGLDKPRLHFDPTGRIYSFQDDINYVRPMNCPEIDCFYINPELPELHIKQSYMLKNYLKTKFNLTSPEADFDRVNLQYNANVMNWNEYSAASGRVGDIGNSHVQHLKALEESLIIPDSENYLDAIYHGLGEDLFSGLKHTNMFKNYVKSMIAVRKGCVGKYFNLSGNNLHYIPQIRSKYYELTF